MSLPDPECKDCKGKGEVLLLTSTVKCFCIDREIEVIEDDPLGLNKDFIYKLKEISDNKIEGWENGI